MRRASFGFAAALAVLALGVPSLRAQPAPGARARAASHVKQGQAFFQIGDFDHALAEYQAALDLSAEPSLIFNIALCHDRANRPEQALQAFRHYLEVAPDGTVADEAREDIARLTPIVEKIEADRTASARRREDPARRAEVAARPKAQDRPSRVPVYLMIAGAAVAGVGAMSHVLAWRTRDRLANAPDPDSYFTNRDKLRLERDIAIGAYAAGALTIATGLILRGTVLRSGDSPQLSLAVTPGGAAFAVEWSR